MSFEIGLGDIWIDVGIGLGGLGEVFSTLSSVHNLMEHPVDIPICTAHPFIFFMGDKILDKSTKLGSSLLLGVHFKRAEAETKIHFFSHADWSTF